MYAPEGQIAHSVLMVGDVASPTALATVVIVLAIFVAGMKLGRSPACTPVY